MTVISGQFLTSVLVFVALVQTASAQMSFGVALAPGKNGRPIITHIDNPTGTAAYLGLEPGDEIHIMDSDLIIGSDGKEHERWVIYSVKDVLWILNNTRSRIGVTYKRGNDFYETSAIYEVHCGDQRGERRRNRPKGTWIQSGPHKIESPYSTKP